MSYNSPMFSLGYLAGTASTVSPREADHHNIVVFEHIRELGEDIERLDAALAAKPSDEDLRAIVGYHFGHAVVGGVVGPDFDYDVYHEAKARLIAAYLPTPERAEGEE